MSADSTLRRIAVRGMAVASASQGVRLVVQLVSVVTLSRLLAPGDFGVLAMVAPPYALAVLLQDLGLSQAAVQARAIAPGQVGNLFWLNVVVSLMLGALLWAGAPALAAFYGEPAVAPLTRAFAALVVVSGLAAQPQAMLSRQMRFGWLSAMSAAASVAGLAVALGVAAVWHSVWALFAGPAAGAVVTLVVSWAATGWRPGWPRRGQGTLRLLRFGGGLAGTEILGLAVRTLDNVLIGWAWGNAALGVYDRAYKLLLLPLEQVGGPLSRVMLPTLARLADNPARYRHAWLRMLRVLLFATQPGIVWMIASADTLVPALLGEAWRDAAPVFRWLGVAGLHQPVALALSWLLINQGRTKALVGWAGFNAATCTAAFAAGLPWGGVGVAAAYSLSEMLPRLPALWWMATRRGPVGLGDLLRVAVPFVVADAVAWGVLQGWMTTPGTAAMGLALSYLLGAGALMATQGGRAVAVECARMLRPWAARRGEAPGR